MEAARPYFDAVGSNTFLLKDLKAAHIKGLENGIAMPFNALSSALWFDSWGQRPKAR